MKKFTKEEFMKKLYEKNEHVRNGEIEILGEYNGLEHKIDYICHKCNTINSPVAASLMQGHGCYVCGAEQSHISQRKTNQEFQLELSQLRENGQDVYTDDEYINNSTKIWFYCSKGHRWQSIPATISRGGGCPYCSGKKVLRGFNDIATTSPDIFMYLLNKEDGYKHTRHSNKRTDFQCLLCGHIQNRKIGTVAHRGFKCECCGSGLSYPNKFGRALFDQFPVKRYKAEYYPDWGKPYIYDIYFKIYDNEYIVEWDGSQHTEERDFFGLSLDERRRIDKIKDDLAKENNVHLIRVDCAKSDPEYIRKNIEQSELSSLFDLSKVDWKLCDERAQKNLVKMVCDLWMSGIQSFDEISKMLHLGNSTVRDYINRGTRLGWCDYDSKWWIDGRYLMVNVVDLIDGKEYLLKGLGECADFTVNIRDHRISEETIRKYAKNGVPYSDLLFTIIDNTVQN